MLIPQIKELPIKVDSAAVFPYSEALKNKFSAMSRFGDPIVLYRELGMQSSQPMLQLPRGCCPIGPNDNRDVGIKVDFESTFKPRNKEQARVVKEATALLLKEESFLIEAPTGTGKTVMAMQLIANVGRKTLVIVTKEDVKNQWVKACRQFLGLTAKDIGIIQGDKCDVNAKKVVITMIQSVCKRGRYPSWVYRGYGLLLVDETHRLGADKFGEAAWLFPAKLRLGLSATPLRKDGKDIVFRSHIGPVKVKSEVMPLIPKVIIQQSPWQIPMTMQWDKKTGQSKLKPMPHTPGRTAHITKMLAGHIGRNILIEQFVWKAYQKGRNIVVFSDTKAFLEKMYLMFSKVGVPRKEMGFYIGGLKEAEQDAAKVKRVVLTTYAMCSEATDAPWWDTAVLATPRADAVQIVGRVIREYEGKRSATDKITEENKKDKVPVVFDIRDDSSNVFRGYGIKREKWYHKIGAPVIYS